MEGPGKDHEDSFKGKADIEWRLQILKINLNFVSIMIIVNYLSRLT